MVRAYPDIPEDSKDRLAKNHFMDAVEGRSVREGINRGRPHNLDEADHAALEVWQERRGDEKYDWAVAPSRVVKACAGSRCPIWGVCEENAETPKSTDLCMASNAIIVEKRGISPESVDNPRKR